MLLSQSWTPQAADLLTGLEGRVQHRVLKNGLHIIVLPRSGAPAVSIHMSVDAGSADDPPGRSGLAHMLEHLAFKGTRTIGSKNPREEARALKQVDKSARLLVNAGFRVD